MNTPAKNTQKATNGLSGLPITQVPPNVLTSEVSTTGSIQQLQAGMQQVDLTLATILENLRRPIPARFLQTKTIKGTRLTFCPWYRVNKILDHYTAGHWHYEVRDKMITTTHILVTVRITIEASDATIYREGTGIEVLDTSSYGDPQSNAESMAFRRAAARFGLGLHLYEKED